MGELSKGSFYDTLFKISEGNIDLFKKETKEFVTAVADRTGAAVQLERATVLLETKEEKETGEDLVAMS